MKTFSEFLSGDENISEAFHKPLTDTTYQSMHMQLVSADNEITFGIRWLDGYEKDLKKYAKTFESREDKAKVTAVIKLVKELRAKLNVEATNGLGAIYKSLEATK